MYSYFSGPLSFTQFVIICQYFLVFHNPDSLEKHRSCILEIVLQFMFVWRIFFCDYIEFQNFFFSLGEHRWSSALSSTVYQRVYNINDLSRVVLNLVTWLKNLASSCPFAFLQIHLLMWSIGSREGSKGRLGRICIYYLDFSKEDVSFVLHSFVHLYQYGLEDIYFLLCIVIQCYCLFCYSNCPNWFNFDWNLFQFDFIAYLTLLLSRSLPFFALPGTTWCTLGATLKSAISLRIPFLEN